MHPYWTLHYILPYSIVYGRLASQEDVISWIYERSFSLDLGKVSRLGKQINLESALYIHKNIKLLVYGRCRFSNLLSECHWEVMDARAASESNTLLSPSVNISEC